MKKAILHRKNSLFYKTQRGARVGDLFMSLIYTCQLSDVNPFDYLIVLLRNFDKLVREPAQWMPWNYSETLGGLHARFGDQLTRLALTHAYRKDTEIQIPFGSRQRKSTVWIRLDHRLRKVRRKHQNG